MENATSFLPNMAKFFKSGVVTTRARDQMPAESGPNWTAILTGQGPEESGVANNDWVPTDDDPPSSVVDELPPINGPGKVKFYS